MLSTQLSVALLGVLLSFAGETSSLLKVVGQIAGIGGISLGVLLLLFRSVLSNLLQQNTRLTRRQVFILYLLVVCLTSVIALAGLGAWAYVETKPPVDARTRIDGESVIVSYLLSLKLCPKFESSLNPWLNKVCLLPDTALDSIYKQSDSCEIPSEFFGPGPDFLLPKTVFSRVRVEVGLIDNASFDFDKLRRLPEQEVFNTLKSMAGLILPVPPPIPGTSGSEFASDTVSYDELMTAGLPPGRTVNLVLRQGKPYGFDLMQQESSVPSRYWLGKGNVEYLEQVVKAHLVVSVVGDITDKHEEGFQLRALLLAFGRARLEFSFQDIQSLDHFDTKSGVRIYHRQLTKNDFIGISI